MKEKNSSRFAQFVERAWISIFCSFLFQRLVLSNFWGAQNQFAAHWRRTDALAITLAILAVAAVILVTYYVIGACGKGGRWLRDFAYMVLAAFFLKVALVEVMFESQVPTALSWTLNGIILLLVVAFLFLRARVMRILDGVCLVLSPIVLIFIATLLLTPSVPACIVAPDERASHDARIDDGSDKGVRKVIVVIFDAMSYRRTFAGGLNKDEFPGLHGLAEESIVFHRVYSTANYSEPSIAGMMCGVSGEYRLVGHVPTMIVDSNEVAIRTLPSLFQDMKERGYRTRIFGVGLPYASLFGSGVDHCEARVPVPAKAFGVDVLGVAVSIVSRSVCKRAARVVPQLGAFPTRAYQNRIIALQNWIHAEAIAAFRGPESEFTFFHYEVPHYPYLYSRDGPVSLRATEAGVLRKSDYRGNLQYVDTLVRELHEEMRASDDYERTLLIVTSDHSLRSDTELRTEINESEAAYLEYCRVPLLIHLPGQTNRVDIESHYSASFLRQHLTEYIDEEQELSEFVQRCESFSAADMRCWIDKSYAW